MSVVFVSELTLGALMPGIVLLIPPLLAGFDLVLTGQFGLGALSADITLQLNAALSVQLELGLSISNPFAAIQAQLSALLQIQASLQAALSLGLPTVSAQLSLSISASAGISAALGLQLGGISALIKASLALKIPLISLLASLEVGPADILTVGISGGPDTLASAGAQFAAMAVTPGAIGTLLPTDDVIGIILLTRVPAVGAAMQVVFGV